MVAQVVDLISERMSFRDSGIVIHDFLILGISNSAFVLLHLDDSAVASYHPSGLKVEIPTET